MENKINNNIFLLFIILIIFFFSGCSNYEKYYNFYSGDYLKIYYPKELETKYIDKLDSLVDKESALFYEYFLPGLDASKIETVVIIDKNIDKINYKLLESINKNSHILCFDIFKRMIFNFNDINLDFSGFNIDETNLIFLVKLRYDSLEWLTTLYIGELVHILLNRNSIRNGIKKNNEYNYITELFSYFSHNIYTEGKREYSYEEVQVILGDIILYGFNDGYPEKLKKPDNFNTEKLSEYIDDFSLLLNMITENEKEYDKFKKTFKSFFSGQYKNMDQPFIENYGKTLEELTAEWSPDQM